MGSQCDFKVGLNGLFFVFFCLLFFKHKSVKVKRRLLVVTLF